MGDVPKGTVYVSKSRCSILFPRYVDDPESNYIAESEIEVTGELSQRLCRLT